MKSAGLQDFWANTLEFELRPPNSSYSNRTLKEERFSVFHVFYASWIIDFEENPFSMQYVYLGVRYTLFHKHHRYKHHQPEIWPKHKHQPSTSPSLTSIFTYIYLTQ